MEVTKLSACIKRKFCFEDFAKPLAFSCVSKNINRREQGIKIS